MFTPTTTRPLDLTSLGARELVDHGTLVLTSTQATAPLAVGEVRWIREPHAMLDLWPAGTFENVVFDLDDYSRTKLAGYVHAARQMPRWASRVSCEVISVEQVAKLPAGALDLAEDVRAAVARHPSTARVWRIVVRRLETVAAAA